MHNMYYIYFWSLKKDKEREKQNFEIRFDQQHPPQKKPQQTNNTRQDIKAETLEQIYSRS